MGEVRSEIGEVRSELSEVRSELGEIRTEISGLHAGNRRFNERLDRGFGANYETRITNNIESILGQQLGIQSDEDFEDLLEQAERNGAITWDETVELPFLDIIVAGTQRADRTRVYVAAEVSITANQDDVNRAAARAEIIQKATQFPARPVVIADRSSAAHRQLADQREVEVAIYPE